MSLLTLLRKILGCDSKILSLQDKLTISKGEREYYKRMSEQLSIAQSELQATLQSLKLKYDELLKLKDLPTDIDINFHQITSGNTSQDEPSAHSPLTREEMYGIANNIAATSKELRVIELFGDTNSMEPNIDDNHLIILYKYDSTKYELKIKDIVRYKNPSFHGYVLHRIIDIRTNSKGIKEYRIKGDNNPIADGWFTSDVIVDVACGNVWGEEPDGELND